MSQLKRLGVDLPKKIISKVLSTFKSLFLRFLTVIAKYLFRFIPATVIQRLLKILYLFPLNRIINILWPAILRNTGYRYLLSDWSEFVVNKTNDPGQMLVHIDNLLHVQRLDEIGVYLDKAEKVIYSNRRFNPLTKDLFDRRLTYEIEVGQDIKGSLALVRDNSAVGNYFYHRMWASHAMRHATNTVNAGKLYFSAVNYNTDYIINVWHKVFEPNGLIDHTLVVIDRAITVLMANDAAEQYRGNMRAVRDVKLHQLAEIIRRPKQTTDSHNLEIRKLLQLKLAILVEKGDFQAASPLINAYKNDPESSIPVSRYMASTKGPETARDYLHSIVTVAPRSKPIIYARITGELGEIYEEAREFKTAIQYYRMAHLASHSGTYLASLSYPWRYMTSLMGLQRWDEAIAAMRQGQEYMWDSMHKLSKTSRRKRLKSDFALNPRGALFLGGWGLGDETLRLSILRNVMKAGGKYGVVVDPRLKNLAQKSLPDITFYSNSRIVGPFAVKESEFWKDREGVTAELGYDRTTQHILSESKKYPDIAQSEDLTYHYMKQKGNYQVSTDEPLFKPDPQITQNAKDWLNSLPGDFNVGISWRSGQRSHTRDKSYTDILEWEKILKTKGVNFVNLQYSDTSSEVAEVKKKFDVQIQAQPGIDLKDDIEEIVALSAAVDLVISPCTASLELAGAAGTSVLSLAITPWLPDLWRVNSEDNESLKTMNPMHFSQTSSISRFINTAQEQLYWMKY